MVSIGPKNNSFKPASLKKPPVAPETPEAKKGQPPWRKPTPAGPKLPDWTETTTWTGWY